MDKPLFGVSVLLQAELDLNHQFPTVIHGVGLIL